MMTVHITCPECGSGINIYPSKEASSASCDICQKEVPVKFDASSYKNELESCPCCFETKFYKQKDFNRKIGVILFVIAAILAIWTYGVSLIVLYLFDLILFKRLGNIVVCYNCDTVFREVENLNNFEGFDHETNDRIKYADQTA